jgi:hypothetical protein
MVFNKIAYRLMLVEMTFTRGSGVRRGRTGWTICGAGLRPDFVHFFLVGHQS